MSDRVASDEPSQPGSTVLVVDDSKITRVMASSVLAKAGYSVTLAESGVEALELLRTDPSIRIVITDWDMDDIDGIELCRHIRTDFADQYRFIIMLTGRDEQSDAANALETGADEFIRKPVVDNELIARVKTAERLLEVQMRDALILSLAKLAESRDTDTGDHIFRTRAYCRILAAKLCEADSGLPSGLPEQMWLCSPLHDIGKVGVPDSVLKKPSRLDKEERAIMETHTVIGAETIATAMEASPRASMLRTAYDIVRHHHERWDGAGYPDGIAGTDIPLSARIMSVADVYDALRSSRVYKPPMTHEKAFEIIVEGSGTQFDPAIVDAMLAAEDEFKFVAAGQNFLGRAAA